MTGTGRAIVADADIVGCHDVGQTVLDGLQRRSHQTFGPAAGQPRAKVCAASGYAPCGGLELVMRCDLAFVSEGAKLGHVQIKLGLIPGGSGARCLPRVPGSMRAIDILMPGQAMPAAEAVETGAALETGAHDALMSRTMEFAEALAEIAPVALREARRVVENGFDAVLNVGLTRVHCVLDAVSGTEGGKEGIIVFMEEGAPAFKGQ